MIFTFEHITEMKYVVSESVIQGKACHREIRQVILSSFFKFISQLNIPLSEKRVYVSIVTRSHSSASIKFTPFTISGRKYLRQVSSSCL